MLAKRVIPTVLVRGKTAYKGPGFGAACARSVGSALSVCRTHAMRGVDELLILDVGATADNRGPDLGLIEQLSDECFIPITVGGGVRRLAHIDEMLRAGADKVAICTGIFEVPGLLQSAADRFGRQAITAVIEVKGTRPTIRGGSVELPQSLLDVAALCDQYAGEIVVQSVNAEGTLEGYDLLALQTVAACVGVPVIASGGCSGPEDMERAIQAGADACAAGALFQWEPVTPRDCSEYLRSRGMEVRA